MNIFAETHLFGSVDGYTTLAASAAIRNQDFGPLESLGFGQPSARGAGRLREEPVILAQPIGRAWMAITRAVPGPPDTAGRETIQRLTLVFKHRDYRQLVRNDLPRLLSHPRLWNPDHFSQGRRLTLPVADTVREPGIPGDHALRVLQGWSLARRESSMAVFPLGTEIAILELLRCLHANDLPLFRWGLRLLSSGALADVATLLIDDGLATRKPIVRTSLDDPLDLPTIRRFDGLTKPLPALFGQEPPEEMSEETTVAGASGEPWRTRIGRTAAIAGGGTASLVIALATWLALARRDGEPSISLTPPEPPPGPPPAVVTPEARSFEEIPSPTSVAQAPTPNGPQPEPDPKPPEPPPPSEFPVEEPVTESPAIESATPSPTSRDAFLSLEEAIEEVSQYTGNRVPDQLDADLVGHVRRLLRALETLARERPRMLEVISRLERDESVTGRGIVPNDLQNAVRDVARFFVAIETVPAARSGIRRARDGERVLREELLADADFRRAFGIDEPPHGESRPSDRNAWSESAVKRIERWSAESAHRIRKSLADSLTEAADGIGQQTASDEDREDARRRFADEIEPLLSDFGLELAELPGPAALDLTSALQRFRGSQKSLSSGREESLRIDRCVAMVEDARRVLRYVDWMFEDFSDACVAAMDSFKQLAPSQRLDAPGRLVIRDLRNTLEREGASPVEAISAVRSGLLGILSDLRSKRLGSDPRLEDELRSLDSGIRGLRSRCQPQGYQGRRGTGSILEDLPNMERDLQAIAKEAPNCFDTLVDGLRQGVMEWLDAARKAERLDESGYQRRFAAIEAELRALRAEVKRP